MSEKHNVERIEPVISKEAEAWENTPTGCLANLQAAIDLGQIRPKEMVVIFYDRADGQKRLVVKAVGAQQDRLIGMMDIAKMHLILDTMED